MAQATDAAFTSTRAICVCIRTRYSVATATTADLAGSAPAPRLCRPSDEGGGDVGARVVRWLAAVAALVCVIVLGVANQKDSGFGDVLPHNEKSRPIIRSDDSVDKPCLMVLSRGRKLIVNTSYYRGSDVFSFPCDANIVLRKKYPIGSGKCVEGIIREQGSIITAARVLGDSTRGFLFKIKVAPTISPFMYDEFCSNVDMDGSCLSNVFKLRGYANKHFLSLAGEPDFSGRSGAGKPHVRMFKANHFNPCPVHVLGLITSGISRCNSGVGLPFGLPVSVPSPNTGSYCGSSSDNGKCETDPFNSYLLAPVRLSIGAVLFLGGVLMLLIGIERATALAIGGLPPVSKGPHALPERRPAHDGRTG